MTLTDYHAKYFAHELTKRCSSDSLEKLAGAVAGAQVDLNPHQVDAALFAFHSPLSKGALIADEVGLGKTIEAGLVISQKWAERKRKILVIVPSNLRKQWYQELTEKFFLPCQLLETKSYNAAVRQGDFRPFEAKDKIVICSYQFARKQAPDVANLPWDLVVIDEAHRLRNVYKPTNIIANTLKQALKNAPKLLLTATPLQNSLLELFGLVSFIDEHAFGDLKAFREQFANLSQEKVFDALKSRLKPICHRTLRRQVTAYVPFTKRHPILEEFIPEESEDRLYELVSEYLRRENLQALPASQRSLMTLVLRKLLASSTFAIAGALESISKRLKAKIKPEEPVVSLEEDLDKDYEAFNETAEEWSEEEPSEPISDADHAAIEAEVADLDGFAKLATSIEHNAKGNALVKALGVAFKKTVELGAAEKAIIFTESRKTQSYLLRVLADSPFKEGIVLFNGSNTDERSRAIYAGWLEKHAGTDRVSGSRTADMRSALVDYFRDEGRIMIATEAGAEGINLQFCSLVVNYDLPWNPQRIEQRIGRCHRYGQKHDVVVVNFLNRKNAADQRVYELLSEKFQLFEGVFGASDEVLGAIESGVDFEKRINDIYQRCRKHEEIKVAFDKLQLELNLEINQAMTQTRRKLLENFDDEVREKLKISDKTSKDFLNRYERLLMQLTRHELNSYAEFVDDSSFRLNACPFPGDIPLGLYELPRRSGEAHLYRLAHPLAEAVVAQAKSRELAPAEVRFSYEEHEGIISTLEDWREHSGWLAASALAMPLVGGDERFAPIFRMLGAMRVYSIQPAKLREMQDPDSGVALKPDGSNAASVLQELLRGEGAGATRAEINRILESIVPATNAVSPKKHGNKLSMSFSQEWGAKKKLTFDAFNMSDGTLRSLGLIMAVFQKPSPSLLVIEEPEATIHPGALGAVLDLIRKAAKTMQVVVTTHSPELLDAKWITDANLRIVSWQEGASHLLPPSEATRQAMRQHHMGAGELLRSNALHAEELFVGNEDLRNASLFESLA